MRRGVPGLPMYSSNMMLELCRLLEFGTIAGPVTHGQEVLRISAGVEFEGFGRASEAWDVVWTLTLPHIRRYVRKLSGWEPSTIPDAMSFKGRDDADCIKAALQFLRDVPQPQPLRAARPHPGAINADALADEPIGEHT